jgi:hypothetical protein
VLEMLDEIERLLVLDALYRVEILDRAQPLPAQVDSAVAADRTFLTIVFSRVAPGETVTGAVRPDTLLISWAELRPDVRAMLAARPDRGLGTQLTAELDGEAYSFEVLDETFSPLRDPEALDAARQKARDQLRHRNGDQLFEEFIARFSAGKNAEIDGALLGKVTLAVSERFAELKAIRESHGGDPYPLALTRADYTLIAERLGAATQERLMVVGSTPRSVYYVLQRLVMKEFLVRDEQQSIGGTLQRHLERLIQEEFLLEEGFARRLHRTPDVEADMGSWRKAYVAQGMAAAVEAEGASLQQYLSAAAGRHGVSVDTAPLQDVGISNFNVMVIRYLGFNNRMPAVPGLPIRFRTTLIGAEPSL